MVALLSLSHTEPLEQSQVRGGGLEAMDAYLFNLWELYKNSSSSERPKAAQKILDAVTNIAYLDSRIDMLGLILFGPLSRWSTLRSVRDKRLPIVDDQQCLKSTLRLFEKHCRVLKERSLEQSIANICNYVPEKAAIKEAIILVCGMHVTKVHDVVAEEVVCRNDSQGLCQCEKDDWRSIQKGPWSSVMSPYEQRFVDVNFLVGLNGFLTVTLDEGVSLHLYLHFYMSQGWRYSSIDTTLATVAVFLVSPYVICMHLSSPKLWPPTAPGQGPVDASGIQNDYYSTFHKKPNRNKLSKREYKASAGQSAAELASASSPEFEQWVINNAHRIKLHPKKRIWLRWR
ncbi:hypothetical protein L1987_84269 [Smallanthus sonchifolius]|uniref:Uncharacterized protein n=1 Tax=Smallanthus sonchifolius TaxID=185202 RepID=A0ACB8YDF9_9ASTR|nr:hypothetical protein L1987_84269 [Smallanthus sonchifolius]